MSQQMEKGLYSLLSANSPQTAAAARIYPRLPQNATYPVIRYQRIETTRQQSLDSNVGVVAATIQLDCIATSYSAAKSLADEVRSILHGYSGTWSTLQCQNVMLESENDFDYQDGDLVVHWVTQRYRIYTDMD